MRSSITIFLIFLLVSQNYCAQTSTKAQDIQYLESIKKTDFGKTVLQSLQLELRTGNKDAVGNIVALLTQLRQDEVDAQANDDANWNGESAQCNSTQADLTSDINDANDQIEDNSNTITLLQANVAANQSALDDANTQLTLDQASLQSLQDQRATDHATYLNNSAQISSSIVALQQGLQILSQLVTSDSSSSFMEKKGPNVFAQFTDHVTNANVMSRGKYAGFIKALVSITSRSGQIVVDQNTLGTVISLINNCIDLLSDELTSLAAAEANAQDIFEQQQTNLESAIGNLNAQIADYQSSITSLNNQILSLQGDNNALQTTVNNKSQQLADSQSTCSDDQANYQEVSQNRSNEIAIIDQVIQIFQTRFDNVSAYLTDSSF